MPIYTASSSICFLYNSCQVRRYAGFCQLKWGMQLGGYCKELLTIPYLTSGVNRPNELFSVRSLTALWVQWQGLTLNSLVCLK